MQVQVGLVVKAQPLAMRKQQQQQIVPLLVEHTSRQAAVQKQEP
jgi:hypothetical protein